jgi:hypothetical protein
VRLTVADKFLPDIVGVTPTALAGWSRCRRLFLFERVLHLPGSDADPSGALGNLAHDVIRQVHDEGECRDDALVADVLNRYALTDDGVIAGYLERHRRRCPVGASFDRHEIELSRFHRPAMCMVTARLDALWIHDGVLDARDYKTGRSAHERVADDPRARLQAWLLAPRAQARGLRLRVRYEYLAPEVDDDPEPFDPEPEDIDAVTDELEAMVAAVRAETKWKGVADAQICRTCRYRSVCVDSASPGEPTWPQPEVDEEASLA